MHRVAEQKDTDEDIQSHLITIHLTTVFLWKGIISKNIVVHL